MDALSALGIEAVQTTQLPMNWHGDMHWRVVTRDGRSIAVRVVGPARPEGDTASDDRRAAFRAQLRAAAAFADAGLPLVRLAAAPVVIGTRLLIALDWAEGESRSATTPEMAEAMGALARRMHAVGRDLDGDGLPVLDLVKAGGQAMERLDGVAPEWYLAEAARRLARLSRRPRSPLVVHGDLNQPNVFWERDRISAVIDFDQTGMGDALEELAWLVKWWSRPNGPGDAVGDPALARAVLRGYNPEGVDFSLEDLNDLIWVASGLNTNSVVAIRNLGLDDAGRSAEAHKRLERSQRMSELLTR